MAKNLRLNRKQIIRIFVFTLALSNFLTAFVPFGNIAPVKADSPLSTMIYGLDYSSADWSYSESESHLRKDFQLFKDNNITLICPWLHWSKIQPTSASAYDDRFLSRIKNLCKIAYEYGIYVDIDLHSGAGSNTRYGLPRWFRGTFDNVATNSTQKTRWINMEKHVVTYLSDVVNIRSFHLFNEPWVPGTSLKAAYLDLFKATANAINALTDKPLTIRFGSWSFIEHGWSSSTIYSFLDFVAINWYPSKGVSNLDDCVTAIRSHSRDVQISEYGYRRTAETATQDLAQNTSIARQISLFKARDIKVALICQYGMLVGEGWNIYNVAKGTPRPAFYTVARANVGPSEVLPPPDEDPGPPPFEPEPPPDSEPVEIVSTARFYLSDYGTYFGFAHTVYASYEVNGGSAVFWDITQDKLNVMELFSVSLKSTNLTVNDFMIDDQISLTFSAPAGTVSSGNFTLPSKPDAVEINGVERGEGDGWVWDAEMMQLSLTLQHKSDVAVVISFLGNVQPSDFFKDNFNSADFDNWSGTRSSSGAASVVDTLPYLGDFHAEFVANGDGQASYAYCYKTVNEDEVYARGYFIAPSALPLENEGERFYMIDLTAGQESVGGVGIRRHEGINSWVLYGRDGSGWVGPDYSSIPAIQPNHWYCLELHWKRDAAHGILETYVNGERIFAEENINTNSFGNVTEICFGVVAIGIQKNLTIYGDCFAVSDKRISQIGDINIDGRVNIVDIAIVAKSFGSVPSDRRWNAVADLNEDGIVNIMDIAILATEWSST